MWLGWSVTPEESTKKAIELANKAKNLDDTQAEVHSLFSSIYVCMLYYFVNSVRREEVSFCYYPTRADWHY